MDGSLGSLVTKDDPFPSLLPVREPAYVVSKV